MNVAYASSFTVNKIMHPNDLILLDFETIVSIYLVGCYTRRNRAPPENNTGSKRTYWYQYKLSILPPTSQNFSIIASDGLILRKKDLIGKLTLDAPNECYPVLDEREKLLHKTLFIKKTTKSLI